MATAPLAIHGYGLLPGLLALHLLDQDAQRPLLLLTPEREFGGEQLEPVVASKLSAVATALVNPFTVSVWPGYYLVSSSLLNFYEETVLLLDPVQVWLELRMRLLPSALVTSCGPIVFDGTRLDWLGGSVSTDRLIDLAPLLGPAGESEIVGIEAVRKLDLPILADTDEACESWAARQYLPLGDDRLVVRKLPHNAQPLSANSFENLLNALTSD